MPPCRRSIVPMSVAPSRSEPFNQLWNSGQAGGEDDETPLDTEPACAPA